MTEEVITDATDADSEDEDDELASAILAAIPCVVAFFESDSRAYERIDAICRAHLGGETEVDTQGIVLDALSLYAGPEFAQGLLTLLARASREPQRLISALADSPTDVATSVRALGGIYGEALRRANDFAWEDPDDWSRVTRDPVWEPNNDAWRFNVGIYKYNGEKIQLGLRAGAVVTLTEALLDTLLMPDDHIDVVEEWRVQGLSSVYEKVMARHGQSVDPDVIEQSE